MASPPTVCTLLVKFENDDAVFKLLCNQELSAKFHCHCCQYFGIRCISPQRYELSRAYSRNVCDVPFSPRTVCKDNCVVLVSVVKLLSCCLTANCQRVPRNDWEHLCDHKEWFARRTLYGSYLKRSDICFYSPHSFTRTACDNCPPKSLPTRARMQSPTHEA